MEDLRAGPAAQCFPKSLDREAAVLITIFRSSKESSIDVKADAGSGET